MSLFGSLIPGVREVRAPLVAGYLWLICLWLLLEPRAPSPDGNAIYGRIAEIVEAVGPVGKAITVSIAAYLIGSLFQAGFRATWGWISERLAPFQFDQGQPENFDLRVSSEGAAAVETILKIAKPSSGVTATKPLWKDLSSAVRDIADRELSDSYRQLEGAVWDVRNQVGEEATCHFGFRNQTPIVVLTIPRDGVRTQTEFIIPRFLPFRDLMGEIHLLETRLLEIAEGTGARIERLGSEADFRFTIVPPLVALVGILAFGVNLFWGLALVLPCALLIQAIDLSHQRAEQLLGALRARTHTPDLEKITPVFERYRTFATKLSEGLQQASWPSGDLN